MRAKQAAIIMMMALMAGLTVFFLMQLWFPIKPLMRHVDPSAEKELSPLPNFMASMPSGIFDSLLACDYAAAIEKLGIIGAANIPERYKFVIDRFHRLIGDTAALLNDTTGLLDRAEALITLGEVGKAERDLREASLKLASANITFKELKEASEELARTFGLPMGNLNERIRRLGDVTNSLFERLLSLYERLKRQVFLEETFLSLDVEPKVLWTGGSIRIFGRLCSSMTSEGLAGRRVEIFIEGKKHSEALTLNNGYFSINISLPYVYKPSIALQAFYSPQASDRDVYKPSASRILEVRLLYVKPTIKLEKFGEALPGRAFVLKGCVKADVPIPYRSVKIMWAGASLEGEMKEGIGGFCSVFEALLYTPEDIPDGIHALKVETPAWKVFASAQESLLIEVQRRPINLTIREPMVVFAGLSSPFIGRALPYDANGSLSVNVRVSFAGCVYKANSSGEFTIFLAPPITMLTGYENYEVHVSPEAPWYRSVSLKGHILIINPFTILTPIALASVLILKKARGKTIRKGVRERRGFEREVEFQKGDLARGLVSKGLPYSAILGLEWLIDFYWKVVVIVSKFSGVEMRPSMTLREYLKASGHLLGKLLKPFEALTMAVEKALYSPGLSEEELRSARGAIESLKVAYLGSEAQP